MQDPYESPQTLRLFPEKMFYKIGEVAGIAGVESYVLRYWETEFPFLCPKKSKSGQRIYTKKDVDVVLLIKKLLYEEKYTISGVRRKLGAEGRGNEVNPMPEDHKEPGTDPEKVLMIVRDKLRELLSSLS
jgi:DNA-binding transcriptional MerR regulator